MVSSAESLVVLSSAESLQRRFYFVKMVFQLSGASYPALYFVVVLEEV